MLTSAIKNESCKCEVYGNQPEDEHLKQILLDSGFGEHVRLARPTSKPGQGKMLSRDVRLEQQSTDIQATKAQELVSFARERLGRPLEDKPAYGILIDLMENTFEHASWVMKGQVSWWATVFCDLGKQKACYSFVDMGVGIFKSSSFKQRIGYLAKAFNRPAEKIRALLERRIPSRTGLHYRGQGLPWIYESGLAGRIENLVIITNNVYARPLADEYRELDSNFNGTFLYWET
ncbi:MAG: hypothetical protein WB992_10650 [Bryobacteraceae bacterium]